MTRARVASALLALVLTGTALSAARRAAAEPGAPGAASAIHLAESACFDRAELGAEVDRYLDQPISSGASVTVRDDPERMVIESAGGAVEKEVKGWSCKQRLDFAAVSVSIILGGHYTAHEAGPADAGPPDAAKAAVTAPGKAALPPPVLPRPPGLPAPRSPLLEVTAEGGGAFDLLPRPAAALLLSVDRHLIGPLDLHASFLATSAVKVPFHLAAAQTSLLAGVIEGCLARGEGLRLRLCAGIAAGRLAVVWDGLSPGVTPSAWSAAAGRLDARLALSEKLSLAAGLDVLFPLGQQRIDLVKPGVCPAEVPTALASTCLRLTPFGAGQVVESHALAGAGLVLSLGPVLSF